eukprot:5644337-Amphidinium_carterae.1
MPVPGIRPGDFPAFQGGATGASLHFGAIFESWSYHHHQFLYRQLLNLGKDSYTLVIRDLQKLISGMS